MVNEVGLVKNGEFSDVISIEFREFEDGSVLLMIWLLESIDEYGVKFNIVINNLMLLNDIVKYDK